MKRVTIVTGHFGSGKTEFSVNLIVNLKKKNENVAIVDLDIANPYFRSRERQKKLNDMNIVVEFNSFGYDITEDLPAISASIKAPLENENYKVVVDVGGNDSGARILKQIEKQIKNKDDVEFLFVLNANRPETDSLEGALEQIRIIEDEVEIKIDGLVNNTHMASETSVDDIVNGYFLCEKVSKNKAIPIVYNLCRKSLVEELEKKITDEKIEKDNFVIYPIDLYMRPSWLENNTF